MDESQAQSRQRIRSLFRLAAAAYGAYLEEGRTFLLASIIRDYNTVLRDLLFEALGWLPADHAGHAVRVIFHLDVWQRQWEHHRAQTRPTPQDSFVFPTAVPFPKDSADHLIAYLDAASDEPGPT